MKLTCLAGVLAGREIPMPESGLTFGRGKDNDVVLDGDPQASRYHARFERVDGIWHIRDRESANGVFLNGKRIQKTAALADKDELQIGQCRFRLDLAPTGSISVPAPLPAAMSTPSEDATPVVMFKPVAAEEPSMEPVPSAVLLDSASVPLSAVPVPAPPPTEVQQQKQKRIRLLIAGLVGLIIVIPLILWLLQPEPGSKKTATGTTATSTGVNGKAPDAGGTPEGMLKGLCAEYELLKVGPGVMFRYELTLRDGLLSLAVDDPLNNRRVEDSRTLSPEQLKFMGDNLLAEKVLQIQSPASEGAQGQVERTRLLVTCGNRGNIVEVENTQAPAALHEAEQTLLDFAQTLFGISAEPMPLEEAMRQAEEDFATAHRMYEEYKVDSANLYRAVKSYGLILVRLRNYETKPEWFAKCVAEEAAAKKLLDDELAKRKRDAQTLVSAGNLAEACQILAQIRDMVPNRDDHDIARWATSEAVRLEIKMYSQKKQQR